MSTLNIPTSSVTVTVAIINTTAWAYDFPCSDWFRPPFEGLNTFDLCSYSFLITHHDDTCIRKVIFDLGIRKDWENLVPPTVESLKQWGTKVKVEKDVADILLEHGTDLAEVEAIIWR